ncbi:hypothetical protein STSV2_27 [Sulfolobus virus STSV2]|uniref:hypothetical protein n=1 Tax=Sulfolobus virus STSV2 TaxID=1123964 RepID=UPI0002A855FE|nr:hypothetical protein STSV2_27 [Sulfolobus virus STSV2]AFU92006.1 hypothetical protein STSV2_27 [Sulfolobus virus STSV2]
MSGHTLELILKPIDFRKVTTKEEKEAIKKYVNRNYEIIEVNKNEQEIEIKITYNKLPDTVLIKDSLINDCVLNYKIGRLVVRRKAMYIKLVPGKLVERKSVSTSL